MPIEVAGRVLVCWAAAVGACLAVGTFLELGWLVFSVTAIASLPLLAVAILASVTFTRSIVARPVLWSVVAVAISLGVSAAIVGRAALLGAFIALPAALGFVVWMHWRPVKTAIQRL